MNSKTSLGVIERDTENVSGFRVRELNLAYYLACNAPDSSVHSQVF